MEPSAAKEFTHDELLTIAAAGMAMVLAVSQDISHLRVYNDELVAAQAHELYLEATESAQDEAARSKEDEQTFTRRLLYYYRRTREICADDPERFSLLQAMLVGEDIQALACSKRLILAACVPRVRSEMEPTWTGPLPQTIDGIELTPILRAFWTLLEAIIVTPEPLHGQPAPADTHASPPEGGTPLS